MYHKPIAIGAEAVLYLEDWLGLTVLVKERVPKGYRRPSLIITFVG